MRDTFQPENKNGVSRNMGIKLYDFFATWSEGKSIIIEGRKFAKNVLYSDSDLRVFYHF